jgi:hypothetical protein
MNPYPYPFYPVGMIFFIYILIGNFVSHTHTLNGSSLIGYVGKGKPLPSLATMSSHVLLWPTSWPHKPAVPTLWVVLDLLPPLYPLCCYRCLRRPCEVPPTDSSSSLLPPPPESTPLQGALAQSMCSRICPGDLDSTPMRSAHNLFAQFSDLVVR